MKLNLRTAHASERLFWQHRISDCRPPVPIEWVYGSEDESDKTVWIISGDETYNELIKSGTQETFNTNLLIIITEEWQLKNNQEDFYRQVEAIKAHNGEVLLESEYNTELLYQSLFKPRGKSGHKFIWQGSKTLWSKSSKGNKNNSEMAQTRRKICVFGKDALAYELGAALSLQGSCRVLLMDLDRLRPTADVYAGVKPLIEGHYDFFSKTSATGLNVLLDCAKKGALHGEIFSKCTQAVKGFSRFEVLTGVYQQSDYEYYRAEDLKLIIERAAGYYDVVVLKTNSFLYDGFTLMAMKLADEIIAGLEPNIAEIRAYRQMVQLLKEKQGLVQERQYWVMFEDKKVKHLELGFFESLAGRKCIGKVPALEARVSCGATGSSYLKEHSECLRTVYQPIVKTLQKVGAQQ